MRAFQNLPLLLTLLGLIVGSTACQASAVRTRDFTETQKFPEFVAGSLRTRILVVRYESTSITLEVEFHNAGGSEARIGPRGILLHYEGLEYPLKIHQMDDATAPQAEENAEQKSVSGSEEGPEKDPAYVDPAGPDLLVASGSKVLQHMRFELARPMNDEGRLVFRAIWVDGHQFPPLRLTIPPTPLPPSSQEKEGKEEKKEDSSAKAN